MDWKSIAIFHSFKTSGWGDTNITRLMACTPSQLESYKGMDIGPTFVFNDQQSVRGFEDSPTYNKPAGILHFSHEVDIEEEFILFVDADMLFRKKIEAKDFQMREGLVITEWVWYIQAGIKNGLAKQFLTNPKAIEHAVNTHGGYYHLFHKQDARKVSPLWLNYTREVRHHPEKYFANLPGSTLKEDINVHQKGLEFGEAPWISEMYGYAFAAADVGLEHKFTRGGGGVLYGDDFLSLNHDGPFLSHYTLSCHIPSIEIFTNEQKKSRNDQESYMFDKNNFRDFDPLDCNDGFLFPRANVLLVDEGAASCAENVERINYALCDFYKQRCPASSRAFKNAIENCPWNTNAPYRLHYDKVIPAPCGNKWEDYCATDVENGNCHEDPAFMQLNCLKACGFCATMQPRDEHDDQCVDRLESETCKQLADEMECVLNPTYMVVNCRETCGKCVNQAIGMKVSISRRMDRYYMDLTDFDMATLVHLQHEELVGLIALAVVLLLLLPKVILWRRYRERQIKKTCSKATV